MATGDSVNYQNATVFPGFTSKAELIQAISDPDNVSTSNLLELCARVANSDASAWADAATVDAAMLNDNVVGRL